MRERQRDLCCYFATHCRGNDAPGHTRICGKLKRRAESFGSFTLRQNMAIATSHCGSEITQKLVSYYREPKKGLGKFLPRLLIFPTRSLGQDAFRSRYGGEIFVKRRYLLAFAGLVTISVLVMTSRTAHSCKTE